jgi:hypothetical protein
MYINCYPKHAKLSSPCQKAQYKYKYTGMYVHKFTEVAADRKKYISCSFVPAKCDSSAVNLSQEKAYLHHT